MAQVKLRTDGGADLQSALIVNAAVGTGLPADFTGNKHSYLAYYRHTSAQNANTMADGWHDIKATVSNAATTGDHGTLIQSSYNGNPYQIWIPDSSKYIYKRSSSTGWTGAAWSKLSAGAADSASSVPWTGVSDRPTKVSAFTNDTGYLTGVPQASTSTTGIVKVGSNISVSSGVISISASNVTSALGYAPPTSDTTYGPATTTYAGVVKIGNNISVSDGVISLTKANVTNALGYTPPASDTTYGPATTTYAGLMGTGTQSFTGTKIFTDHIYLSAGRVLNLRDNANYYSVLKYDTAGNEAVMLAMKNPVTSFIVNSGDTNTTVTGCTAWQNCAPSIQVKDKSLYVNELITNGTTPSYNFKVNGSACLADKTYIGTAGAYISYNTGSGAIEFNN